MDQANPRRTRPTTTSTAAEADRRRPIGIFDSGVGGLTVARALRRRLPNERLLYFADTAHVPYGPRPLEEVRGFALAMTDFLVARGAKAVVTGCNISSAVALEAMRQRHSVPMFGLIEPGCRAALRASRALRIGVIATQGTVSSGAYGRTLRALNPRATVVEQACADFVPLVEAGLADSPQAREAARCYLRPIVDARADVVVYGCTHYPFLESAVREVVGPGVVLIDPAEAAVEALVDALSTAALLNPGPEPGPSSFFLSADHSGFAEIGGRFLGEPVGGIELISPPEG